MKAITYFQRRRRQLSAAVTNPNHVLRLVAWLLEEAPPGETFLREASVHRSRRGRAYIASFTGPAGGQIWRSTGLRRYRQALALARKWETTARATRLAIGHIRRRPATRVHPTGPRSTVGPFTQEEVAQILGLSVRTVRATERRALEKLRQHPRLRQVWRQYLAGGLE